MGTIVEDNAEFYEEQTYCHYCIKEMKALSFHNIQMKPETLVKRLTNYL